MKLMLLALSFCTSILSCKLNLFHHFTCHVTIENDFKENLIKIQERERITYVYKGVYFPLIIFLLTFMPKYIEINYNFIKCLPKTTGKFF